jgi:hypothetical protein
LLHIKQARGEAADQLICFFKEISEAENGNNLTVKN